MSRPRHQKVSELFLEACKLKAEERAEFLERACAGEAELRAEVESLLAHDDEGFDLLQTGRGPAHLADMLAIHGRTREVSASEDDEASTCRICGGRIPEEFNVCPSCNTTVSREEPIPQIPGYKILRLLGIGGMGRVYLAEEIALGRQVAVKIVSPSPGPREQVYQRFVREARMLARVEHPNIVRVYAFGEAEGRSFLAMEYVEGEGLARRIKRSGGLGFDEALRILLQTVDALDAAWEHGIVHRDIKPSNILIDLKQQVRVADFGLAKTRQSEGDPRITLTGYMVGTPFYISPEQAQGIEHPDFRSDIYSLGIVLYEMLSGKPPFQGATPIEVAAQHLHVALPRLAAEQPDFSDDVQGLCEWMTRKNPDDRPGSYADLRQCIDALLRGLPSPIADRAALPSFLSEREQAERGVETPAVFVGRAKELERLDECVDQALTGEGQVVFVTGEAGCGKSALLDEFTRRTHGAIDDLIVARGHCNAQTGIGDPYLPFREMLGLLTGDVQAKWESASITRDHARRLWDLLPVSAQALVEAGPDLVGTFLDGDSLVSRAAAHTTDRTDWRLRLEVLAKRKSITPADAGQQQNYLFEQYARTLRSLAQQRPLLLEIEDLHWADQGSCSLLSYLGRAIAGSRIVIVGTYRPTEAGILRDGQRHPLKTVLHEFKRRFGDLELNLDRETTPEFMGALLDTEPNALGSRFRKSLYRQTKGHPLFTVELLRAMQERGMLVRDEFDRWVEGISIDWDTLPAQVEGVIEERVGRLPDRVRKVLDLASVQGEEFIAEVLAGPQGMSGREMVTLLSNELDKQHGLITAQRVQRLGGRRVSRYRFRHILFQKYLYGRMDEVERTYFHEEAGYALEALYGDHTSEVAVQLARHFDEAQIAEKAVAYFQQAGERASTLSANEEAIGHLSNGLDRLDAIEDDEQRKKLELGLQLAFGAPLMDSAGPGSPTLARAYTRARELCDQVGEPPQLFQTLFLLVHHHASQGELRKALELAERLLDVVKSADVPLPAVLAYWARAFVLFYLGRLGESRADLEQLMTLYDPREHGPLAYVCGVDPGSSGLSFLSNVLWLQGYTDQAVDTIRRAIDGARELDHAPSIAHTLTFAASLADFERDAPWLEETSNELLRVATEKGVELFQAWAGYFHGRLLTLQGRPEESIEKTRAAVEAIRGAGSQLALPALMISLAEANAAAGRSQDGLVQLRDALTVLQRTDECLHEPEIHRLTGALLLEEGEAEEEAESCLQRSIDVSRRQGARSRELRSAVELARLWEGQGRRDEARRLLFDVHGRFPEGTRLLDFQHAADLLEKLG